MIPIGKSNNKTVEAVGMNAPDGEQVMFVGKVIVDGPVEDWLIKVIRTPFDLFVVVWFVSVIVAVCISRLLPALLGCKQLACACV